LLKSKDPEWVKSEIMNGRSMHISSRKYKFFTSSIVAGIIPIALGTALALKRKKSKSRVWCFIGDMAAETGTFYESWKYSVGEDLPITFIVEDNDFSVYTPTKEVWRGYNIYNPVGLIYYKYKRIYPHYGIGKFIDF